MSARWMPGACPTRKRAFDTKQDAKRALKKARRCANGKKIVHRRVSRVYLCRCGFWHLTAQKLRDEG